jgi:superfamily II DNA or RNA helicase
MNALHKKSKLWIEKGVFDGLNSFADLEARIDKYEVEKDRGDIFEIFIEGYLATHPINQHEQHWVTGQFPLKLRERYNLPQKDKGIDGIYEDYDGLHIAYQVKYRQSPTLSFGELGTYLGISDRFSERVLFTTASSVDEETSSRSRCVLGDTFHSLSSNDLAKITAWLRTRPAPVVKATPDPRYQPQALADIKAALSENDRATVVMACGTGKTLVSQWAVEQAEPKTVLLLLPSLSLLRQTLRDWSEQTCWGDRFSYICVCSDKTVGLDALKMDPSEVEFRVDTDPQVVRSFLERKTGKVKVVLSTYQSSPVVGEGCEGLPPFDIGVFDEAHKTAGLEARALGFALSEDNIRIKKRLFFTATPRHIDIRHRDRYGEFKFASMDDESIYGPRAHTLSFSAAADLGVICPYKVIISLINKEMVSDFALKNGITLVEKDEVGAKWVANQIALQQAIKKVDATKVITFQSRVNLAKELASDSSRGISSFLDGYEVRHVNGKQSAGERTGIIDAFADAPKSILTNARCLTEGVNIPTVDMVAFIDPRRSPVDVTQAVGRAMRKPRGPTTKKLGYVLVPLFAGVEDDDDFAKAIENERFDVVAEVLSALQEHDDVLADIIREIRERRGRGERFNPDPIREKVEVIGPVVELDRLAESIEVRIADRIGSNWDENYGMLLAFREREGHCRVPARHIENQFKLGNWVVAQRVKKELLTDDRILLLDQIGFIWDPFACDWQEGFAALVRFKKREGHCRVPDKFIEGGFKLGGWVSVQRSKRDSMLDERRYHLDELGFIWDVLTTQWEDGYEALVWFKEREGHCLVPKKWMESGFNLGQWINNQRSTQGNLSDERHHRLDELGFIWDPYDQKWNEGYNALAQYKGREGHCHVPNRYIENDFKLGLSMSVKKPASMSAQ